VAADAGDDPLADRREDREAAAAWEKRAKVAKLNSQTANAMAVVGAGAAARKGAGSLRRDGSQGERGREKKMRLGP